VNERYLIISSDWHAGLPCEEYRPYLDSAHLDAFDAFLAEREANRSEALKLNYDYIHDWESTNEEGLRGAFDGEQRDKELDADGVAGEVIFPDADAITGMESPLFGAGLSAGAIADPELAYAGARAHNRFLADLVAGSPARRAGVALVPVSHDVARGIAEVEWAADHGLRGVMIPTMWHDRRPYNDPVYDDFLDDCEQLFGATAARVYGFDVAAWHEIADRIGPTPTDLGQDPARRSDPAEVAGAQWWKRELV
jgi:predicted TIM-barrel fold metal-dependent hydrolase